MQDLVRPAPRMPLSSPGDTAEDSQGNLRRLDVRWKRSHVLALKRPSSALIFIFQSTRTFFQTQLVLFAFRVTSKNNKPKRLSLTGNARISRLRPSSETGAQQKFEAADRSRPSEPFQANVFSTPGITPRVTRSRNALRRPVSCDHASLTWRYRHWSLS